MAYAPDIYTYSVLDLPYNITFEFPGKFSAVVVKFSEPTQDSFSTFTPGEEYDVTFVAGTPTKIVFLIEQTVGGTIRIERLTPRNVLVTADGGENVSPDDFNNEALRGAAVDEEIQAQAGDFLPRFPGGVNWAAEGEIIKNLGFGVANEDSVNLAQVQAIAANSVLLEIESSTVLTFDDSSTPAVDGIETDFELIGIGNVSDRGIIHVEFDGLMQSPRAVDPFYTLFNPGDGGYGGAGTFTELHFAIPPQIGTVVTIRTLNGIVRATPGPLSLDGSEIQPDAIDLTHINIGAGDVDRLMVFDVGGDPVGRQLGIPDLLETYVASTAPAGFNTAVRESRLDQMAVPTASVDMNTRKITDLLAGTPASTDGCNVSQMEGHVASQIQALLGGTAQIATGTFTNWTDFNQVRSSGSLGFEPLMIFVQIDIRGGTNGPINAAGRLFCALIHLPARDGTWFLSIMNAGRGGTENATIGLEARSNDADSFQARIAPFPETQLVSPSSADWVDITWVAIGF